MTDPDPSEAVQGGDGPPLIELTTRPGLPLAPRKHPHPLIRSVEALSAGQTHRDSRQEVNRIVAELLGRS